MRQDPKQVFRAYSFAVDSEKRSAAALDAAAQPHAGRCPDAVFLCAGASRPGYFIDQNEESFRAGMGMTFDAQAFTAMVRCTPSRAYRERWMWLNLPLSLSLHPQAATKLMVKQGVKGKIVFVASVLALMSFIGYTTYSPGKFAIRGECSRISLRT